MFRFSYDPDRVLLTIVQDGYWSMAEFEDYQRAYLAQHEAIRKSHPHYRVLADCRTFPVQAADVGAAFARLFDRLMAENHGHCVILTDSTLSKMQAKRAIPQPNVRVFSDHEEAMDWLLAPGSLPS